MQIRTNLDHLEADEKCLIHGGREENIAYDTQTGAFACNKCVFEKRILNPDFIAPFARKTKDRFDDLYDSLLKNITLIEDLTPQ